MRHPFFGEYGAIVTWPRESSKGRRRRSKDRPRDEQTHKPRRRSNGVLCRLPENRKEEAMITRFDHHPIQMFLALAIVACVILAALTMFVAAQAAPTTIPSVDLNAAPSHSQIVQTMLL
jgi:hypothetical protein